MRSQQGLKALKGCKMGSGDARPVAVPEPTVHNYTLAQPVRLSAALFAKERAG